MGINFVDRFSLLHMSVGIVFYYWGIDLRTFVLLHMLFEYVENTSFGMAVINENLAGIWDCNL